MTDYSKMDDVVINHLVDIATKHQPGDGNSKDYCNNPADAWPIIVKHGISLTHDYGEWESEACLDLPIGAHGTDELCSVGGIDKNPLRAAMIAFLLLKESEKCSS
ncbi:TPA: DUF2591 family protein [Serratia liquefaciens]|nr:DUF2591 family protein [Serratia liquefaciens]